MRSSILPSIWHQLRDLGNRYAERSVQPTPRLSDVPTVVTSSLRQMSVAKSGRVSPFDPSALLSKEPTLGTAPAAVSETAVLKTAVVRRTMTSASSSGSRSSYTSSSYTSGSSGSRSSGSYTGSGSSSGSSYTGSGSSYTRTSSSGSYTTASGEH